MKEKIKKCIWLIISTLWFGMAILNICMSFREGADVSHYLLCAMLEIICSLLALCIHQDRILITKYKHYIDLISPHDDILQKNMASEYDILQKKIIDCHSKDTLHKWLFSKK